MVKPVYLIAAVAVAGVAAAGLYVHARGPEPQADAQARIYKVARRDFVRSLRLSGTVEAVQATTISAPRLAGQNNNSLIVTRLVPAALRGVRGARLVDFDGKNQIGNALAKRAEWR